MRCEFTIKGKKGNSQKWAQFSPAGQAAAEQREMRGNLAPLQDVHRLLFANEKGKYFVTM